jgi:hypothetical protein
MFLKDFGGQAPSSWPSNVSSKLYMAVRYQKPNWNDSLSSPVQYTTNYNAAPNTGLGPFDVTWQRGPIGNSLAQSTFQLNGYAGGMLMRSWDSPHPILGYPGCGSNCPANKHAIFANEWKQANWPKLFTMTTNPHATNVGFVVQADLEAHQFEKWSTITGGTPQSAVTGQLAFVVNLRDPAGKSLHYVIYVFQSDNQWTEGIAYDPYQGNFITSSVKRNRLMTYTTIKSDTVNDFSNTPWAGKRFYRVHITPQNIQDAVYAMNLRGAGLSTDVLNYKVSAVAINQEVNYKNNGDAFVIGSSFSAFGAFEIMQ